MRAKTPLQAVANHSVTSSTVHLAGCFTVAVNILRCSTAGTHHLPSQHGAPKRYTKLLAPQFADEGNQTSQPMDTEVRPGVARPSVLFKSGKARTSSCLEDATVPLYLQKDTFAWTREGVNLTIVVKGHLKLGVTGGSPLQSGHHARDPKGVQRMLRVVGPRRCCHDHHGAGACAGPAVRCTGKHPTLPVPSCTPLSITSPSCPQSSTYKRHRMSHLFSEPRFLPALAFATRSRAIGGVAAGCDVSGFRRKKKSHPLQGLLWGLLLELGHGRPVLCGKCCAPLVMSPQPVSRTIGIPRGRPCPGLLSWRQILLLPRWWWSDLPFHQPAKPHQPSSDDKVLTILLTQARPSCTSTCCYPYSLMGSNRTDQAALCRKAVLT